MTTSRVALLVVLLTVGTAAIAAADTLILEDGRVLHDVAVEVVPDGVVVVFENGRARVPKKNLHAHFEAEDPAGAEILHTAWDHAAWRNRHRLTGPYWTYETTLPPLVFARYRKAMEEHLRTVRRALGLAGAMEGEDPLPTVCIHRSLEKFMQIGGTGGGVRAYIRHLPPRELVLYDDRPKRALSLRRAQWVTAAYVIARAYPDLDRRSFLHHALVDYYGSAFATPGLRGSPGSLVGLVPGAYWEGLRRSLAERSGVDLARVTGDSDASRAWAWSLVHFLLESEAYAPRFHRFLAVARGREEAADLQALRESLGLEDPNAHRDFLAAWAEHLHALAPTTAADYLAAAEAVRARGGRIGLDEMYQQALSLPGGKEAGLRGLAELEHGPGGASLLEALDAVLAEDPFDVETRNRRAALLQEAAAPDEAAREAALAEEIQKALGPP